MAVKTLEWIGGADGVCRIIDQTKLPTGTEYLDLGDVQAVWDAIKILAVRGAPAIGVAAAYGVYIGAREFDGVDSAGLIERVNQVADHLATSRPTAVNLFWALDRMRAFAVANESLGVDALQAALLDEARRVHAEDTEICKAIGDFGAELLKDGDTVLTHCNAGGLATSAYGTALSVIFRAKEKGKSLSVYADETRPLLQGSRLTAWECRENGVPVTLICDVASGMVMSQGRVQAVIVGTDRTTANGDVANKIGTYNVAVLARRHNIPFYVAAPLSSIDMTLDSGADIPIEERDPIEVTCGYGKQTAPDGINVFNPAFDVTPAELVTAFITEKGVIYPPYEDGFKNLFAQ